MIFFAFKNQHSEKWFSRVRDDFKFANMPSLKALGAVAQADGLRA